MDGPNVNPLASSIGDTGNHVAPPQNIPLLDGSYWEPPGGG